MLFPRRTGNPWHDPRVGNRALWVVAMCALVVACGGGARAPSAAEQRELDTASLLGRAIFEDDVVSARATDLAGPPALRAAGTRGWVTTRTPDGWRVDFYAPAGDGYVSKIRVAFPPVPEHGTVSAVDPPEPLDATRTAMVRATEVAKTATFPRCDRGYNPVVLPARLAGEQGWLVYLLAAHLRHGEVVLGGHVRLLVSADGRRLLRTTPLSKGCLIVPPPRPGEPPRVSVAVVTPIGDVPLEGYIYLSWLDRVPIFVARGNALYRFDPRGLLPKQSKEE